MLDYVRERSSWEIIGLCYTKEVYRCQKYKVQRKRCSSWEKIWSSLYYYLMGDITWTDRYISSPIASCILSLQNCRSLDISTTLTLSHTYTKWVWHGMKDMSRLHVSYCSSTRRYPFPCIYSRDMSMHGKLSAITGKKHIHIRLHSVSLDHTMMEMYSSVHRRVVWPGQVSNLSPLLLPPFNMRHNYSTFHSYLSNDVSDMRSTLEDVQPIIVPTGYETQERQGELCIRK